MERVNLFKRGISLLGLVFLASLLVACGADFAEPASDPAPESVFEVAEPESEPWPEVEAAVEEEAFWDDMLVEEPVEWDEFVEVYAFSNDEGFDETTMRLSEGIADIFEEPQEGVGPLPMILPSETGRQLVYRTDIHIETTNFMPGVRQLLDKVAELNGYSERVIVNGHHLIWPYHERNAFFRFRIPTENLNDFLVFVENNYNLVLLDKEMIDMTTTYERKIANLEDLYEREQQILEELEDEDGDATQRDLDQVRSQIRNLEATTAELEHDVIYSNIRVYLGEVIFPEDEEEVEPMTFGERFRETVDSSLSSFVAVLQVLLIIFTAMLPWLTPLVVIGLILFFAFRRKKKKKKNGTPPPSPTSE